MCAINKTSVVQIIHEDPKMKCPNKRCSQQLTTANENSRLKRCKQLLNKFPEHSVSFIWFTDEKVFTVAPSMNAQNIVSSSTRKRNVGAKRILRTRPIFSRSVMVSAAVSQLGCTDCSLLNPE